MSVRQGLAMQLSIELDKSQTLSLLGREGFAESKSQPRRWMRGRCMFPQGGEGIL